MSPGRTAQGSQGGDPQRRLSVGGHRTAFGVRVLLVLPGTESQGQLAEN